MLPATIKRRDLRVTEKEKIGFLEFPKQNKRLCAKGKLTVGERNTAAVWFKMDQSDSSAVCTCALRVLRSNDIKLQNMPPAQWIQWQGGKNSTKVSIKSSNLYGVGIS